MFGEYMVYINDKSILLVCDNTVYLKKQPDKYSLEILNKLNKCELGYPYDSAKEHYILDVDNMDF